MDIISVIAAELGVRVNQVDAAVKLIDEGNTIPFIARYRKEATGALDDEQLRNLAERLTYLRNLEEKKEQVLSTIEEQGKLTEELKAQILAAQTLVVVEDLYRPYRPKRRTRATVAKEKGLEPLANILLLQMTDRPMLAEAEAFVNEEKEVASAADALAGAMDIVAESGGTPGAGAQPGRGAEGALREGGGARGGYFTFSGKAGHHPRQRKYRPGAEGCDCGQLRPPDRACH